MSGLGHGPLDLFLGVSPAGLGTGEPGSSAKDSVLAAWRLTRAGGRGASRLGREIEAGDFLRQGLKKESRSGGPQPHVTVPVLVSLQGSGGQGQVTWFQLRSVTSVMVYTPWFS